MLMHTVLHHVNVLSNDPDGIGYNLAQLGEFEFPGAIRVWNLIGVGYSLVFYPLFLLHVNSVSFTNVCAETYAWQSVLF